MTLRLRLYIAAAILLSVVVLLGVLLVGSVEQSELQQIDQQLRTAVPVVGTFDRPTSSQSPTLTPIRPPTSFQNPSNSSRISEFYHRHSQRNAAPCPVHPVGREWFGTPTASPCNAPWPFRHGDHGRLSVGLGTMAGDLDCLTEPTDQASGSRHRWRKWTPLPVAFALLPLAPG